MKNIMEEVRKFLRTYPPLAEGKLHVDFLPEEAQSYSVEAVPAKEIVRSYVDGSTVRQFLFVVASREFFGDKIKQQLDNLSFYGDFSEWLREQTMAGSLPNLGEGRNPFRMLTSLRLTPWRQRQAWRDTRFSAEWNFFRQDKE